MFRYSTLGLAALMTSPALYHALVVQDLPVVDALTRFLIAVPVSAVLTGLLRMATARRPSYRVATAPVAAKAARTDR
ncbi:hypothetical protein GCM10022243_41240 [Saccharothrix violaceirubra]|uniref:Uncharacterized protein n=1 Tax=Saccharothrix violaceirubra TaxID=413306 RepID=A0A7W7T8A8_9PSEU|nr:hypothetical protein [Saccharothrix violaceirubra]MBB4968380.1 hypothetical protein [Saccharothrix violaceirubra]